MKYQHYVPRFYLEGFQSKSGKVWCYDKKLDKAFQQSPDRLGGETLFYDVPEADKDIGISQFVEKWFHPLEGAASRTLKAWRERLASAGTFDPTDDEMETIATFMVVQQSRTPRGRRIAVDMALFAAKVSFFNFLGETNPDLARQIENPIEDLKLELPRERWAAAHAHHMMNISATEELADILLGHVWLVAENTTRWTYYTSDHPVLRVPHVQHPVRTMSGMRSPGIQIIFPLTPTHSLNLLERTYWKRFEPYHRQVLRQPVVKDNIDFDNSAHVIHSSRFIYSRDGDFDLAKDMCRQCPEMRNPDRPGLATKRGSDFELPLA